MKSRLHKKLKRWWRKLHTQGIEFQDAFPTFDRLYRMKDPWDFECPWEENRREVTRKLLLQRLGQVEKILEVGCAEGHQTRDLVTLATHVTGIDPSFRAIARARKAAPTAHFEVTDLLKFAERYQGQPFDLVTAFEVLYLVRDVPAAISALTSLGKHRCAGWYNKAKTALDSQMLLIPGVELVEVSLRGHVLTFAFW